MIATRISTSLGTFGPALVVGVLVLGVAMGLFVTACKEPLFPMLASIEAVVAADLAAGDSDAQMASDVCHTLGGSSLVDTVCADVTSLIADVISTFLRAKVLAGPSLTRAQAMHGRLMSHTFALDPDAGLGVSDAGSP